MFFFGNWSEINWLVDLADRAVAYFADIHDPPPTQLNCAALVANPPEFNWWCYLWLAPKDWFMYLWSKYIITTYFLQCREIVYETSKSALCWIYFQYNNYCKGRRKCITVAQYLASHFGDPQKCFFVVLLS